MQHEGHHLHEVGKIMWVLLAALAITTIAIGLIGFAFEEQLQHIFGEHSLLIPLVSAKKGRKVKTQ